MRLDGSSKLDPEKVKTIRFLAKYKVTYATIADMYGIDKSTVDHIVSRKTWAHVEDRRPVSERNIGKDL